MLWRIPSVQNEPQEESFVLLLRINFGISKALREIRILKAVKLQNHVNIVKLFTMVRQNYSNTGLCTKLGCLHLTCVEGYKHTNTYTYQIRNLSLTNSFEKITMLGDICSRRWRWEGGSVTADHTRLRAWWRFHGVRICWLRLIRTAEMQRRGTYVRNSSVGYNSTVINS